MDQPKFPSHPLEQPQLSQTPYRFHAHVGQPKKKTYKLLIQRISKVTLIAVLTITAIGAVIFAPTKYQTYCEQNPNSGLCQPLSLPLQASVKANSDNQASLLAVANPPVAEKPKPTVQPSPSLTPTAVPNATPAPISAAVPNETGNVALQIGAYPELAEAQRMMQKAQDSGVETRIVKVELPKKGIWYRVQAGRFVSREMALQTGQQLRAKKIINDFLISAYQTPNV